MMVLDRFMRVLVCFALVALPAVVSAESAGKPLAAAFPKGHYQALDSLPDWGGVWILNFPPAGPPPGPPPLKGKYLKAYEDWAKAVKAKEGDVPRATSNCLPPGMPAMMTLGQYPIEFIFSPGRVTMHHEAWMQWRNIYTDGRKHAEDLDPTFQGDSIGHWEGDTLVVETIGVKEDLPLGLLSSAKPAHSPKLRILERIHLDAKDADTLVVEMTLVDEDALTKPWSQTLTYKRSRDLQLLEFVCAENDRNPVDADGKTGFIRE
jgi:hypothetical protein